MKYTSEKAAQVVISLLKQHGIRRVVASPGSTNMALVASLQSDSFFEMFSCVDERSAAYIACGLAAETGEPIAISCTGATASRNYPPGLTEAFYRKLPILAITSTQPVCRVGHHIAQVIDRSVLAKDIAKLSVNLPIVKDDEDLWECEIKVNTAILELFRNGGGPVHINLPTTYEHNFTIEKIRPSRIINRVTHLSSMPSITAGTVGIIVGSHKPFSQELVEKIDRFCEKHNGAVFCDHTSSYTGTFRVEFAIVGGQKLFDRAAFTPDLLVHIGEVTGDYYGQKISGKEVWRISEDGEIRDTYKRLRYVFEMTENEFFEFYIGDVKEHRRSFFRKCSDKVTSLRSSLPEIPFSNIWIASQISTKLPEPAVLHFGILNSLRAWNFFPIPESVKSFCNVGGFGIDGALSTLIGASFANPTKLYFGIVGDLAFFYDMNALGNRHIGKNLRLLVVNNGKGTEFRQYGKVSDDFGDSFDLLVSAAGHFGNRSPTLVKHYAEDLGFKYLTASNKSQFMEVYEQFTDSEIGDRPILFESFTRSEDESKALEIILNLENDMSIKLMSSARSISTSTAKKVLGDKFYSSVKSRLR